MRLLLDTHVAIWALVSPKLLPEKIAGTIASAENSVHVSVVSIWEIAIKFALGKPSAPPFSATAAAGHFQAAGYRMLDVTVRHASAVEALPPIHADPFDRLIIAQAMSEPLRLITRDRRLAAYSDTVISW